MNIKLKDLLNEKPSPAAQQAKAKGLKSKGFGNWADSSGKVTHQTKGGQLVPTKEPKEPSEKKAKKKKKKKSAKDIEKQTMSAADAANAKMDKDAGKKEKPKKEKPTSSGGEANRTVSKAQQKREADAAPQTVHDRGDGHYAGKNPDGSIQGYHGKYGKEMAQMWSKGEVPSTKKAKSMNYNQKLKDAGIDPNDEGASFKLDGGESEWDIMMDGDTPSKSWWEDLMTSFEKNAGELAK